LVRLLRLFPDLPRAADGRAALNANLTAANLLVEAAHFEQPNRRLFERPHRWAWALKLAEELHGWLDAATNWLPSLSAATMSSSPVRRTPSGYGLQPNLFCG